MARLVGLRMPTVEALSALLGELDRQMRAR
jgi:hypothetical protein